MSDLLHSQIKESCMLALPNGLKELMSDISREVLRAQPANLYDFITSYLAALLVTRENLSIGHRICQDICEPSCRSELYDELKNIGLDNENASRVKAIIEKYLRKDKVDESKLMIKLMRKTSISEDQLELVQEAVRNTFLQQHINKTDDDTEMPLDVDDVTRAALHTLQLYAESGPTEEEYNQKASRIQAAYRAYGVRRLCESRTAQSKKSSNSNLHENDAISCLSEIYFREFCEKSSNEAVYEANNLISEIREINIDNIEAEIVDDEAVDADNESDVSVEEDIGENKGDSE